MKAHYYIALLAILMLTAATTAQVTRLEERHCQFTIPAGWTVAPKATLDAMNERVAKLNNVHYETMLIPDPLPADVRYALIQFLPAPMERATHEDLKSFVSSLSGKELKEHIGNQLASANVSDFSMDDARLDLSTYRYTLTGDVVMPDGHHLKSLITGVIGTKGVIHFMTYALPDKIESVRLAHEQLAGSCVFDPGFAYTSEVAAAAQNHARLNWSGIAVKAAIGAGVGAAAGIFSWLKGRKAA